MTVSEIDRYLSTLPMTKIRAALLELQQDPREGIQKLIAKYEKKRADYENELIRLDGMMSYERSHPEAKAIAGIDEAGRGPLAGPVVAAAVILPPDKPILYLNDSKKLTEKKREELYDVIMAEAVSVGVGIKDEALIDEINILNATKEAMKDAVNMLDPHPDLLLIDAVRLNDVPIRQVPIIKGDAKSCSIAAASIIAKVTRDRIMRKYDALYPEYGFRWHKGYGSAEHISVLLKQGPCPLHRRSFIHGILGED